MIKKDFIKQYNGKRFKRYIESLVTPDELKSHITTRYTSAVITENETYFKVVTDDGTIDYRKDNRKQDAIGVITFRSSDYYFIIDGQEERSYGQVPPATHFTDNSFYILDYCNNKILYTIED